MPEGDEQGGGEDLFEDLDKFFAPIQDVDWPETSEPKRAPAPSEHARSAEPERDEPERDEPTGSRGATQAFEAPLVVDSPLERDDDEEPLETGPTPGQEDLFAPAGAEPAGPPAAWDTSGSDDEGGGVSSFLFEAEAEEYDEIEVEETGASPAAPGAYVDLPGPTPEDDDAVAELLEGDVEEAPDMEAVEAAADHFAESVRDEPEVPATPVDPRATEEVAIAALLGEEDGESEAAEVASRTVRVGNEGLGGPSWQEPTAVEVGVDSERRSTGRDVPLAFLTGLVLVGLALGSLAIGPGWFAIFAGLVVLFAQGEYYLALQKRHYQPATALGLVSGALVLGAGYYRGEGAMLAIMALSMFATFLWYMTVPPPHRRNVVTNVALTVLGVAYIPLLAAYALSVLKLPDGSGLALSIVGLTFVYDTAAFAVGYFWGSRPLAPNVSPKKSWEGAIGATLVTIAVAVGAVAPSVEILDTLGRAVGLAVVVAIFAPLGDLAESLIKRDLGVKDMGGILPGHGGVMDRIDAVLFVAPAAFIYLRLILL